MGRYPLRTTIGEYMRSSEGFLAHTTYKERERKLRAFAARYEKLCDNDAALEQDPARWTEREVSAILLDMRKRGLSLGTQKKELGHVNAVLKFVGNAVMPRMKARNPHMMPRGQYVRGPSLNPEQLLKVLQATEGLEGWHGEVARFVISIFAYTGLRMSELRLAQYQDLDMRSWTLRVRHPKGEGSYGEFRIVPLPGPVRPTVERFLGARERMLAEKGLLSSEALVPRQRGHAGAYYSAHAFEEICGEVRQLSGVKFDLRTLRRTYGQTLLNRGVELPTVSLMLGHASTVTTEKYYCRKDADAARLEVVRAFEESVVRPSFKTPKIDGKSRLTGYA